MPDQRYTYHGPTSGLSIAEGEGAELRVTDVMLYDGEEPRVDGQPAALPSDHDHVRVLVAQGRLVAVEEEAPAPEDTAAPHATATEPAQAVRTNLKRRASDVAEENG